MTEARRLVDKLWSYCNVLRDDGVSTIEYTEQLTYLFFLKMAHERETRPLKPEKIVPANVIFRKAQNRIQDPARLKRLVVDLIDKENWSASGTDIKGDAYESLLAKDAEDIKSVSRPVTPRESGRR